MNAADLPVVKMCDSPGCGGWKACDRIRFDRRTMGSLIWVSADTGDADILRLARQDLATAQASDSAGVMHLVPACEFTVHKGRAAIPPIDVPEWADGHQACFVIYSGPELDLDEILRNVPEWTADLQSERLRALAAA